VSIFTSFSPRITLLIVCFGLEILFLKFICIFLNPYTVVSLTSSDPQWCNFKISNHKLFSFSSVLISSTTGLLHDYIYQMLQFFHVLLFIKIIIHSFIILHYFISVTWCLWFIINFYQQLKNEKKKKNTTVPILSSEIIKLLKCLKWHTCCFHFFRTGQHPSNLSR